MKIDLMKVLTDRMPRKVAVAAITMAITLVIFGSLFLVLGGAHDDSFAMNQSLKGNLDRASKSARQARDDRQFILDNQTKYDELLAGDRLVPHTQRVAGEKLAELARNRGITFSGSFSAAGDRSATVAASQPASRDYRVKVEKLELRLSAALDTQIFEFMLDLGESFPGSAVVEKFSIERAADITTDALNNVSRGADSGLVKGDISVTWRTAQAEEKGGTPGAAPQGAR